jgi:hypothetical protein
MKTIKLLFLLVAFSTVTFYSCSDSNAIEKETVTQKSIAMRTALNKLKVANNISGKSSIKSKNAATTNPFCFEFVYPIVFSYNNGTAITASNFQGLLDILANESPTLYLEGIVFPFHVISSSTGTSTTISSESELVALLQSCGFTTINNDLLTTACFEIIFPISVTTPNNQTVVIHSLQELTTYMNNPSNGLETQIVFPISVTQQGQVVVIHNLYELYQMTNNCESTCICTQEYAPVCVQTTNGIVEFVNLCYAICAGYTQNDIVSCNPSTDCHLTNLQTTPGSCNTDGTYPLTINFTYSNPTSTQFEVINSANVVVGTYPLSALPLTLPSYPNVSAPAVDYLTVKLVGNTNCSTSNQWTTPTCPGVCTCQPVISPVCVQTSSGIVQYDNACLAGCAGYTANDFVNCNPAPATFGSLLGTCFTIAYPVNVQYQGAIVTVNSDGQLLQYYFPNMSYMPQMSYPITVTFTNPTQNITVIVSNQAAFEALISSHCN